MRPTSLKVGILASTAALIVACNTAKGPAEAALQAADTALTAIHEEAGIYMPDEINALNEELAAARESFDAGDFAVSGEKARAVTTGVTDLGTRIEAKKGELTAGWESLSTNMPTALEAVKTKLASLQTARRLPKGIGKEALQHMQNTLATAEKRFQAATEAFVDGDLITAVGYGTEARTSLQALMAKLEMQPVT